MTGFMFKQSKTIYNHVSFMYLQASIRLKSISGSSTHWCGAVVVSQFHVITAGHCLRDYVKSAYFVTAGDYDREVLFYLFIFVFNC